MGAFHASGNSYRKKQLDSVRPSEAQTHSREAESCETEVMKYTNRNFHCINCSQLKPINRQGWCEECAEEDGQWEPNEFICFSKMEVKDEDNEVRDSGDDL